jgi:hypothetical protein
MFAEAVPQGKDIIFAYKHSFTVKKSWIYDVIIVEGRVFFSIFGKFLRYWQRQWLSYLFIKFVNFNKIYVTWIFCIFSLQSTKSYNSYCEFNMLMQNQ